MTADDFEALLDEARQGSDSAMGNLLDICRNYLMMIANKDLGHQYRSKVGASDAVQSTLLLAQDNLDQFRGATKEELLGWLRNILRNQIHSTHRRFTTEKRDIARETEPHSALVDDQPSPNSEAVLADEAKQLRDAMQRLPTDHRTVIVLRNWEQLSFAEIGERMDRSPEAVKKLWSRAIAALKKEMQDGTG